METKEFTKNFPRAILLDMDKKTVWLSSGGEIKIYSKDYYEKMMNSLDLEALLP